MESTVSPRRAQRLSRFEQLIAVYEAAKQRRLTRRARRLWRTAEAYQRFAQFEVQTERIH